MAEVSSSLSFPRAVNVSRVDTKGVWPLTHKGVHNRGGGPSYREDKTCQLFLPGLQCPYVYWYFIAKYFLGNTDTIKITCHSSGIQNSKNNNRNILNFTLDLDTSVVGHQLKGPRPCLLVPTLVIRGSSISSWQKPRVMIWVVLVVVYIRSALL